VSVGFDLSLLEKISIGGVCFAIIYFGFQVFKIFVTQWQNSTDAVNKNTNAFNELSKVFERAHEREAEFQAYAKEKLEASEQREKTTLKKVIEIHEHLKG